MKTIPICAVSYNRKEAVKKWIESLLLSLEEEYEYELYIHDNNSKDGTYEFLKETIEKYNVENNPLKVFAVYQSDKNIGKPKALNNLFMNVNKDYKFIVSSDSDLILPKGWTSALLSLMEETPKLGMLSPLYVKNSNNPVLGYDIIDKLIPERNLFYFRKDIGNSIAGGFIMLSAEAFWEVGGYTEAGIYGGNDAKLNTKLANKGYDCAYTSKIYIEHLKAIEEYNGYEGWKRDVHKKMHRESGYSIDKGFWD